MLELYHNDMSVCAQKVRMVLVEKKLDWKSHHLNLREGEQFSSGFLKLNPKALVPVLLHEGNVLLESNNIIQYLDEVYPEIPLMPNDAATRAKVRSWLIKLDSELHVFVAYISFSVAFREQVLKVNNTPESLEQFFKNIPDPARAEHLREMITLGFEAPKVKIAIVAYNKLLNDIQGHLQNNHYLAGNNLSLADLAYASYINRLEQLQLSEWWKDKPEFTQWWSRLKESEGYRGGIEQWNNEGYLELMKKNGQIYWPKIQEIIKGSEK